MGREVVDVQLLAACVRGGILKKEKKHYCLEDDVGIETRDIKWRGIETGFEFTVSLTPFWVDDDLLCRCACFCT